MASPTHTLVLIDDDPPVLRGLDLLLQDAFPQWRIQTFECGQPAVAFCCAHAVEVLVTDLGLPDLHGLDVIRKAREGGRVEHVVVMTGSPRDDLPRELWDLGVAGFIDKTSLHDHVLAAIARVRAGGIYFSAQVTPARLARQEPAEIPPSDLSLLSPRERDVARLVAAGLLSKEIADRLNLSPRTVEKHRANLMHKLGVRSVPQLVYWCLRHGLA